MLCCSHEGTKGATNAVFMKKCYKLVPFYFFNLPISRKSAKKHFPHQLHINGRC